MQTDSIFTLHRGTQPLLVSVPHAGRELPGDLQPVLSQRAHQIEDTDWHLDRLYAFVVELGASFLVPRYSRYTIDLNRPGDNMPMYPGANNTELCPTRFFTGDALYEDGGAPDEAEVERRRLRYWRPYHDAIAHELDRLRAEHGHAVLFDGHSIKGELPWLFPGSPARPQPRHGRRRQLRCVAAHDALERARTPDDVQPRGRRSIQGRSHHAPLRPTDRRPARGATRDGLALLPRRQNIPARVERRARKRGAAAGAAPVGRNDDHVAAAVSPSHGHPDDLVPRGLAA